MKKLQFISPRDGDMLSDISGTVKDGKLEVEALVLAPEGETLTVNGAEGRWCGGCYRVPVTLDGYQNTLTAVCGGQKETAAVYWLRHAAGKYSLSVDDNIWFLADLTKNQDVYASIFDNLYLHVYKMAHEQFGVKVRLNLFYEMDNPCGLKMYGPFDLSMMTDRYKEEFRANAHWLRLAFHSRTEFPGDQYSKADAAKMTAEYGAAIREIKRFAGEEVLESVATIHCGTGNPETVRALRDCGLQGLMGFLKLDDSYEPSVSYYLTQEQVLHANEFGFWKDHATDMVFGKIEVVLNSHAPEAARLLLDNARLEHPRKGYVEFMIHEQYFYPTYHNHLPDFTQRVLSACQWAQDNGYRPAFVSEMLAEAQNAAD